MLEEIFYLLSILPILAVLMSQLGLVMYIIMKRDTEELTELNPLLAIEMSQLSRPKHEETTIARETEQIHTPVPISADPSTNTTGQPKTDQATPAPAPELVPVPETAPVEVEVEVESKEPSDDVKYWLSLPFGEGAGETEPQPHPIKDVFEELRDKGPLALFSTDVVVATLPDWAHDTLLDSSDEPVTLSSKGYSATTYGKYRQDTRNLKVMTLVPTTYLPAELLTQSKYNLLSQTTVIASTKGGEISRSDVAAIRSSIKKQLLRLKVPESSYSHSFYISPDYTKLHIIINYHNPITGIDAKCATSNILQEVRLLRSLMIVRSGTDYVF